VEDDQRVAGLGMLVEALGQEQVGPEMHGTAPELRQELALDPLMADVLCVLGGRDGRDLPVEDDADGPGTAGVDAHLARPAQEVARGPAPLLALAAVHGQLDDMAVRPVERLVLVEKTLDGVFAGGQGGQASQGIAESRGVDESLFAGGQAVDVDAEDELRGRAGADLEAWLGRVVGRDEQEQAAVEGCWGQLLGEREREPEMIARRLRTAGAARGQDESNDRDDAPSVDAHGNPPRESVLGRRRAGPKRT
jgi:hypothetical protein